MVGRTWARCVLGLLVFSAALFFTLQLAPLREGSSFILFVGATAVSSWLAGAAFGLAVTSLGALAASFFIFTPAHSAGVLGSMVPLATFIAVALLILWIDLRRKKAEEALDAKLSLERESRDGAEASNRAKEDSFATISHELRGPLNAILTWVRVLQRGKLDRASTTRALETIARNARAEARLVGEMLDVSRAITGKVLLDLRPVELAPLVEQGVDSARPAAEERGVHLDADIPLVPGTVVGDPDRLAQVVRNLLSNAIKFTPKGGRVAIQLGRIDGHSVTITVRDTGQGIRGDFLAHVFDRFRQGGSPALARAHGGLGLGLAIVRDLVELHGGTVRAESGGEGEGARFTVTLPASSQGAEPLALPNAYAAS